MEWDDSDGEDEPGRWEPSSGWEPEPEDWPRNLAGPGYWLYRKDADDEEGDDGSSTGRG